MGDFKIKFRLELWDAIHECIASIHDMYFYMTFGFRELYRELSWIAAMP